MALLDAGRCWRWRWIGWWYPCPCRSGRLEHDRVGRGWVGWVPTGDVFAIPGILLSTPFRKRCFFLVMICEYLWMEWLTEMKSHVDSMTNGWYWASMCERLASLSEASHKSSDNTSNFHTRSQPRRSSPSLALGFGAKLAWLDQSCKKSTKFWFNGNHWNPYSKLKYIEFPGF